MVVAAQRQAMDVVIPVVEVLVVTLEMAEMAVLIRVANQQVDQVVEAQVVDTLVVAEV